jgi:hypothetical protein
MEDQSIEGRLLAHRRILQIILREAADMSAGGGVEMAHKERTTLREGQEDTGAVETPDWL